MPIPDDKLSPDSRPWGRWVTDGITGLVSEDQRLWDALGQLGSGDGSQAKALANMQSQINSLLFELKALYTATGNTYPPGSTPPAPPVATTPTTRDIEADWSRTWGSSTYYTGTGEYTNATYLYQGQNPENKVGMWHYNTGEFIGKNISSAQLFLQNVNSPWSPTFVAQFGTHNLDSAPTGKPGRTNPFDVGWSRGEGKWHPLPGWVLAGISNGTIKGFTVGAAGPSDPNSAYFMGVGQPNPPRLRVTYS